ncbi:uncharacterized protein LOC126368354 [Pectinophora gossypiella]|uniref:uncharacterized protein LOC126368354 n=1 Tax=Pectinophora gossypiella TaxID=13191 RepID=UPI00214E1814|nr:uncharacterized protein LOC126368354 [Pectinophora gossypiella]
MFIMLIILTTYSSLYVAEALDNWGPYVVEWKKCHGCNSTNMGSGVSLVSNMERRHPDPIFHIMNFTITDPVRLDEIKVTALTVKEGRKVLFGKRKLTKPCDFYASFLILEKTFHVDKDCILRKGTHVFDVNLNELTRFFMGKQFIYGHYYVKALALNKKKMIMCVEIVSIIKKS